MLAYKFCGSDTGNLEKGRLRLRGTWLWCIAAFLHQGQWLTTAFLGVWQPLIVGYLAFQVMYFDTAQIGLWFEVGDTFNSRRAAGAEVCVGLLGCSAWGLRAML